MNPLELNLQFPDRDHVNVRLDGVESGTLPFVMPLTAKDLRDVQWYVETYGVRSLGDPDDKEANRISALLPEWGKTLFNAVFQEREPERLFNRFQDAENGTRLLTVSAEHPAILTLPWELLHDPSNGGVYLFNETPRISIRRRVPGALGGRLPYQVPVKDRLHLLFVVSRPEGAGFIDPRADAGAVMDALDEHALGCVTCEFLRPATLDALLQRLEDPNRPAVDIVHFDGHGVFDARGGLPKRAKKEAARRGGPEEDFTRDKKAEETPDPDAPPNMGYLLFEGEDGENDYVSAEKLGANLHRHKVALVVLSACQSAAVGEEDGEAVERPMGSVAVRLTATGIPAVIAMTHSVLVPTTQALFGEFYKELGRRKALGESLDNARRYLANHPEKYEIQRGAERVWLELHDWFLPALYQSGNDLPLLNEPQAAPETVAAPSNLPGAPETGFFGRSRELWNIERWFADKTRRVTLTGFGGQGKTALALEAGRWLLRTGLFRAAVWVDYARIQSRDAVTVAVSNIGSVLGQTLADADAATEALHKTPTLVILDNLEALEAEALKELLDAAVKWSETNGSRVLCTTRRPDFQHPQYRVEGTRIHRRIQLEGLGSRQRPDDALDWCDELMKLPPEPTVKAPKREAVIELFDRVKFHPLSIRVLAQQLKTRGVAELGERLEELLAAAGGDASRGVTPTEDTPEGLLASLQLSLDGLDDAAREVLPRLGVFKGGAMEDSLLAITGLGVTGELEKIEGLLAAIEAGNLAEILKAMGLPDGVEVPLELATQIRCQAQELAADLRQKLAMLPTLSSKQNLWPTLRGQLEAAAIIEVENLPELNFPYLRFHPTLAPMLWAQLSLDDQVRLSTAHTQQYAVVAGFLYNEDVRHPYLARAIAWRELPNLIHAVNAAVEAGGLKAMEFVDRVNQFLVYFGLRLESEALDKKAQAAAGEAGSQTWFLAQSSRGEQLWLAGQATEAAKIFQAVLDRLGDMPTFERAVTLARLGRTFRSIGRSEKAMQCACNAIAVLDKLEQTDNTKRSRSVFFVDSADALCDIGQYAEARKAYEDALKLFVELDDLRSQGATLGQLGSLAIAEGRLEEASNRCQAALDLFRQLGEPSSEAAAWHQLGMFFSAVEQWDEAERHFRESARIREELGDLADAVKTWNNLATVAKMAGKLEAAEGWYRKAIRGARDAGDLLSASAALHNFANLLQSQPGQLAEARRLAEQALGVKRTIESGAAEIWKSYELLAQIVEKEAAAASDAGRKAEIETQARDYRRQARKAKWVFPGTRHELQRHLPLILAVIAAAQETKYRPMLDQILPIYEQRGWGNLVAFVRSILDGERDEETLCESLSFDASVIVMAILGGLADPSSLQDLIAAAEVGDTPSE